MPSALESHLDDAADALGAAHGEAETESDEQEICAALQAIKNIACPGNRMPALCTKVTNLIEEHCGGT